MAVIFYLKSENFDKISTIKKQIFRNNKKKLPEWLNEK